MERITRGLVALMLAIGAPALAGEVGDLDINMPNTLEDAFAGEMGSLELSSAARTDHWRRDGDTLRLFPRLQWVPVERFQLSVGLPYGIGSGSRANQGEASLGLLWQLNRETPSLPAFALSADMNAPVGPGERGHELRLGGIVTRTPWDGPAQPRLHLNLFWYHRPDPAEEERRDRWRVALGASRLLAPETALVVNALRESQDRGQREATILEAGLRHQVARGVVLGGALGAGLGRDAPAFRAILSVQFSLGGG
jgi:hypothetical protein